MILDRMSSRIGTSLYTHGEPKNDTAHVIGARGNKSSTSTTCIIWSDETKGSESVFENRISISILNSRQYRRYVRVNQLDSRGETSRVWALRRETTLVPTDQAQKFEQRKHVAGSVQRRLVMTSPFTEINESYRLTEDRSIDCQNTAVQSYLLGQLVPRDHWQRCRRYVGEQSAALNGELGMMAEYVSRVSGCVVRCQLYTASSMTVINEEELQGETTLEFRRHKVTVANVSSVISV
ncbi:hypothetical protein KCV07_g530, partial [Aureobasidium melanogenum]